MMTRIGQEAGTTCQSGSAGGQWGEEHYRNAVIKISNAHIGIGHLNMDARLWTGVLLNVSIDRPRLIEQKIDQTN